MGQALHGWRYRRNINPKYVISLQIFRNSLAIWVLCSILFRHLLSLDTVGAILSGSLEKIDTFNQVVKKLHSENYRIIVNRASGTELLAKNVNFFSLFKFNN